MTDSRRTFLGQAGAGLSLVFLAACKPLSQNAWLQNVLNSAEGLNLRLQRLFAGSNALAREYTRADISSYFRPNGSTDPGTDEYAAFEANAFRDWRLKLDGLVEEDLAFSLDQLRGMPSRTQITRHDCVEGWSCIGEWKGVQLSRVLALARPQPQARYAVFWCADPMGEYYGDDETAEPFYYESLDLIEANHPQTILAYELNGATLPKEHGAPVRLRAERQLGYKQAKYVMRIELVASFKHIRGGRGGYWEDQGYNWYGGI